MGDYRDKLVLIRGEHVARCIGQDFYFGILYFEATNGVTFEYQGEDGLSIIDEKVSYDDVKHMLPKWVGEV